MGDEILIRGARLHNLKNITLTIPKNQLVVLTGVSGSGKSTLGFDILFKEGQRQYLEALGFAGFGLARPPVESITGLSPTVSVDQRLTNRSPRSTVGTSTQIYTYLRILYARLGHRPCPNCGKDIQPPTNSQDQTWQDISSMEESAKEPESFPCPNCGEIIPQLSMAHFSFNKPEGACPTCMGLGVVQGVNVEFLVDKRKSILDGAVAGWNKPLIQYHATTLRQAAQYYGFEIDLSLPVNAFPQAQMDLLLYGVESPFFRRHYPDIVPPRLVRQGRFEGIATNLLRRHAEHSAQTHETDYHDRLSDYIIDSTCLDCEGSRLRARSRVVIIDGVSIVEASSYSLSNLKVWLEELKKVFSPSEKLIAEPILVELSERLDHVIEAGAGYLSLERAYPSLSAGEAQRLRLASLLGSGLSGLLYIFDEPTIGTHPLDTQRLIGFLRRLRDLGNTILVIEHDLDVISAADHVIDFGPGGGKNGGEVIATGNPGEVARQTHSLTGGYLSGRLAISIPLGRRTPTNKSITIHNAREHNLKDITVRIPLGLLVAITGVSGSGKSTLIFDILDRAARQHLYHSNEAPGAHDSIDGFEFIEQIVTIDQEHIGRIPRSNVATYLDIYSSIRETFADTVEAKRHGFTRRYFSFNMIGGRCEQCEGSGVLSVKMQLLPEIEVTCPNCHGRRFVKEILGVHYRGYDISQVLDLTVDEALEVFADVKRAFSRLQVLSEAGLGYLQLGQPATTLSGGEAQRVKLSRELGKQSSGRTLYLLDEPTTSLHLADTEKLLQVLQRLVKAGNSVIFIEHNLDMIRAADWIIDLGPEGGESGGYLIAQGNPEEVASTPGSFTGQYLHQRLAH